MRGKLDFILVEEVDGGDIRRKGDQALLSGRREIRRRQQL